jgi:putative ABC transport system permease protein
MQGDFNLFDIFGFLNLLDEELSEIQSASTSYVIALILFIALLIISRWQGLDIGDKLIVGAIRGTIQILLLALILVYVFQLQNLIIMFGVLTFMCLFAAYTVGSNLDYIPNAAKTSAPGILIGGLSVMLFAILLGVVPVSSEVGVVTGEFVIPMGAMVIGNCMGLVTLTMDRMWSNAQKQRSMLESALALGATPEQATDSSKIEAIRSGMTPNLNRFAALGVVTIPGLMSGMIIGGTHPIAAAFYQIIVFILIFLAVVIASTITSKLILRVMFNQRFQLKVPPPE